MSIRIRNFTVAAIYAVPRSFYLCLPLLALIVPVTSNAQWRLDPILRAGFDYDDNATLSELTDASKIKLEGYIAEASVDFIYNSATTTFSARPMLRSRRYQSELDRDSDDQFLRLRYRFTGQFNRFDIRGNYSREGIRTAEQGTSELDTEIDPDEIEDDDTNILRSRGLREKFRARPRWTHTLSSVSSFTVDANLATVEYQETTPLTPLADYTDSRFRLFYERDLSSRNSGLIMATARQYDSEAANSDVAGYGISLGFRRSLSEKTTFNMLAGIESTESDGETNDPKFVTDISLIQRLEITRLLAQYRRRIAASGRGNLRARNELNLRLTRYLP